MQGGGAPAEGPPLLHELGGHRAHPEPQEVLDLAREDDQGDAAREPDGDRVRDELDGAAEPGEAEAREEDAPGHPPHRENPREGTARDPGRPRAKTQEKTPPASRE